MEKEISKERLSGPDEREKEKEMMRTINRFVIAFALLALAIGTPKQARAATTAKVACGAESDTHITYRTRYGIDTPGVITEKLYGHASWWHLVMQAAGIDDPRKLPANITLTLPAPCEALALMSGESLTRTIARNNPTPHYRVRNSGPSERAAVHNASLTLNLNFSTIKNYVISKAEALGVNPRMAEFILWHESQYCETHHGGAFRPKVRGDDGRSVGCWQINLPAHPDVSTVCAEDFKCSTDWSLRQMAEGKQDMWTTWRFRRRLYPNDRLPTN